MCFRTIIWIICFIFTLVFSIVTLIGQNASSNYFRDPSGILEPDATATGTVYRSEKLRTRTAIKSRDSQLPSSPGFTGSDKQEILANNRIAGLIWFKAAKFLWTEGLPPAIAPELESTDFDRDFGYYIVKFDGETTKERKQIILKTAEGTTLGADIFYYVPNNCWIFRLGKDFIDDVKVLPFVNWVGPLIPSFRIRPELLAEKHLPDDDGKVGISVWVFQSDDYRGLAEQIEQFDIEMIDVSQGAYHEFIEFRVSPEKVREVAILIANYEGTEWVERNYPDYPLNDWSRWITQSYNTTGMGSLGSGWNAQMSVDYDHVPIYRRGLYGQNQLVGYLDSGLDTNSVYFCDQGVTVPKTTGWIPPAETGHRKIRAYNRGSTTSGDFDDIDPTMGGHGTHVGGSIGGEDESNSPTGGTYDAGDGMAPLCRLVFTDGANGTSGIYTPADMNTLFGYAQNCGAFIHSNSYGSTSPTTYGTDAAECDEFMWNSKSFLVMFANGNENNDTPPTPAADYNCAKNIVSVGASESGSGWGYTTWNNPGSNSGNNPENMAEFSTHGPTGDGLMKPNLATPGGWYIFSADNVDGGSSCHSGMEYMGGTSMACPTCAGMTALIRQYFMEGYYPSGSATPADAFTPTGALMKAMLLLGTRNMTGSYTIDDLGNSGHQDAPSNGQGWGRVVLDDCMFFDDGYGTDTRKLWVHEESPGFNASGQNDVYTIYTGSSVTEPIKVVLSFTDYPGNPAAGTPNVNDINLTVDISGNTYKGNVFAASGARSITGGSYDEIERDEIVWLDAIPNETMTITISSFAIRTSPQPYALTVAGDIYINSPPETPELTNYLFDNERQNSQRPTNGWKVPADGEGEDLHFRFQWDDDSDFLTPLGDVETDTDPGFTGGPFPVTEGTGSIITYTFQSDLTDGNTYWWRVCANDGSGYGGWTEPRSFTVQISASYSDWFQTTEDQFDTDSLVGLVTSGDELVLQTIAAVWDTLYRDDGSYEAYDGTGYDNNDFNCRVPAPAEACTLMGAMIWVRNPSSDACTLWMLADSMQSATSHIPKRPPSAWMERRFVPNDDSWTYINFTDPEKYYLATPQEFHVVIFTESANTRITLDQTSDFDDSNGDYYSKNNDPHSPWEWSYTYSSSVFLLRAMVKYPATIYDEGEVYSTRIAYADNPGSPTSWDKVTWTENDGDSVVIRVQYRDSGSWVDYAGTGTVLSGTSGEFDISGLGTEDTIRVVGLLYRKGGLTPTLKDWAVSWAFGPPNNPPVVSNVSDGSGWHGGNITITYDLSDDDGENCTVSCEWWDGSWHPTANVSGDGIGSPTAPGTGKSIIWQSATDYPNNESSTIQFRITPNDGHEDGTPGTDNDCDVDNKAPVISASGSGVSGTWGCYTTGDITLNGTDGGSGFESGCPRYSWTAAPTNCGLGIGYTDGGNPSSVPAGDNTLYIYGRDDVGNEASDSYNCKEDCDPPTQPGTPTTSSPTCDDTPTWTWTASTDALSGMRASNTYHVFWSTTPGGEDFDAWVDSPTYTHTVALASPDVWYCKVIGYDEAGNPSTVSDNGSVDILEVPASIVFIAPGKTTTSLTWNWNAAAGATSYDVNYEAGGWTGNGASTSYLKSPLGVNTEHYLNVRGVNASCMGPESGDEYMFTYANVPDVPNCAVAGEFSIFVDVEPNGNPSYTEFAIYCVEEGEWVQAGGALGAGEVWQNDATWGTIEVTGLSCATTHNFRVKARNGDNEETALGASGSATTAACGNQPPNIPTIYSTGSSDQLCFNNVRLTDQDAAGGIQLRFRMTVTDPDAPADDIQYYIQINSVPDWSGTNIYNGDLSGVHSSGAVVDKLFTCSTAPTAGTTYYVRARAKDPYGNGSYGNWTSGTWTLTYVDTGDPEWHQTTDEQFETGTLVDVETDGSNRVKLSGGAPTDLLVDTGCADGSFPNGQNYEIYSRWTPSGSGTVTVTHLWFWDGNGSISTGEQIEMAMYNDGGGNNKIGGSDATLTGAGTIGWISGTVTTPFDITLGNTYFIAVTPASSSESYAIYRDNDVDCPGYPPNGSAHGSYYQNTDYTLDTSVPTGNQTSRKYIIPGITYETGSATGTIFSSPIGFDFVSGGADWNELLFTDDETNGDIKYDVQYWNVDHWEDTPIIDQDDSPVDISSLDPATHDSIRIEGKFTLGTDTPYIEDWTVTWSISTVDIVLLVGNDSGPVYDDWDLGLIQEGDIVIMDDADRIYIRNDGSSNIDISLMVTTPNWSFGPPVGNDQCVVMGLFNSTTAPIAGDFNTGSDYINSSYRSAEVGGNFAGLSDGVDIAIGAGEELYLFFEAPIPNNQIAVQDITITVKADVH